MKAEIIETKKNFEPIEIKLVIESEEELCDLWHRLNIGSVSEKYACVDSLKHGISNDFNADFFYILNRLVEAKRLKV